MSEGKTPKILDEEHLLDSANDSARHFRNIYAIYLTVMIYTFIIVLSTDQELLFRAGDKQLPPVHISLPIVAFFTWMPWALLVLHFYLFIQVMFLSDKVLLYKQRLYTHLRFREDIRKAKMLLASLPLVYVLVEERVKLKYATLYLIVFVSLAVFPLIVLIITQITFLPYQSEGITWLHRIVILIDILVLWGFGHHIFGSHEGKAIWINSIAGFLGIIVLVFVVIFINFPGNKIYNHFTASFYELEVVNEIIPNRFVLPNRKLVGRELVPELLTVEIKEQMNDKNLIEPRSTIWCQYADSLDLKGRNFREARLQGATLCKATIIKADLTSADLKGAILTSADLSETNLTSADLFFANLTSADLSETNLISASFQRANLTFANFFSADLTDALLWHADLTSADLKGAILTSADLERANLTSADLSLTNLSRANFLNAILDDETILDFTWVWESSGSEEKEYFPTGIPKGWRDTLKPEYLCPLGFDISGLVYLDSLKQRIKRNCKPYEP